MLQYRLSRRAFFGTLVVILGGLGLGFASSHFFPASNHPPVERSTSEPGIGWSSVTGGQSDEKPRAAPAPVQRNAGVGKRALLVGVTKYDNIAASRHLKGPGNDVQLLRATLGRVD